MLEVPARYPLLRGRRPIERRRRRWRLALADRITPARLRWAGGATAGAMLLLAGLGVVRWLNAPDPAAALMASAQALRRGDYSAAMAKARISLSREPGLAAAHALLARAALAAGDGEAADGELQRAAGAGYPAGRLHHLFAHAYWLEGDGERALDAARRAPPRYAGYATRIRARVVAEQGDGAGAERMLLGQLIGRPQDGASWTALGRVRLQGGDMAGATFAAAKALALRRGDPEVLTLSGEIVRVRYGLTAALPWFRSALRRDRQYAPALIEEAATLGDLGRHGEMLAAARGVLAVRPGDARALYLMAVLAARADRFDLARAMLARTGGQVDGMPGALLLGGLIDLAQRKPQQAIGALGELVARQPMNVTARRLLGAAQWQAGDVRGTLATLRPIALRADADSYTLRLVARAFERLGQRDWAARYLDRAAVPAAGGSAPFGNDDALPVLAAAVAQAPDDPRVAVEYVRGLVEAGRLEDALAQAGRLADGAAGAPAAQLLVGDVLVAAGRAGEATAYYRRAADLDFAPGTLLRLIEAEATAGRPAQAARALHLFLAQNPRSIAGRRLAANLQLNAGAWEAAIATLQGLRRDVGNRDAVILAGLARAYAGAGDAAAAVGYGRAAYTLAPGSAEATDAYAWARYQADDIGGALQLSAKAAALAPADPVVGWHRAQLLAEAGRKGEARAVIARLLAMPGFAERAAAEALAKAL